MYVRFSLLDGLLLSLRSPVAGHLARVYYYGAIVLLFIY